VARPIFFEEAVNHILQFTSETEVLKNGNSFDGRDK
jgi:hypothetical protein